VANHGTLKIAKILENEIIYRYGMLKYVIMNNGMLKE
jgi:hypothetical protein